MKLRTLASVCLLACLALPAFAVSPYTPNFGAYVPTGYTSYTTSTALSGTLQGSGCTLTWNIGVDSADVHCWGTIPNTVWTYNQPNWQLYFLPNQEIGMNVTITSGGSAPYTGQAPYYVNGTGWLYMLNDEALTGSHDYSFLFPTCARVDFKSKAPVGPAFDITIHYAWGSWAVPAQASSWGDIKALYR